jgi:hypothetical protein
LFYNRKEVDKQKKTMNKITKIQIKRENLHQMFLLSQYKSQRINSHEDIILQGVIDANEKGFTKYTTQPFVYFKHDLDKIIKNIHMMFYDSHIFIYKKSMNKNTYMDEKDMVFQSAITIEW